MVDGVDPEEQLARGCTLPHRTATAAALHHRLHHVCTCRPTHCPLFTAEAEALLLEWGRNELQEKKQNKFIVYLKHRE